MIIDTNMETNMDMDMETDRDTDMDTDKDRERCKEADTEICGRKIVDVGCWISPMLGQPKMGTRGLDSDRFFSLCRLKAPNIRCQMPSTNMYFSVFAQLCQKIKRMSITLFIIFLLR